MSMYPFNDNFASYKDVQKDGIENIDCLLLWGGTDVHPSYYKEKPHPTNQAGVYPSNRDEWEWKWMLWCKKNDIPIIGICRGAQFGCAFAGGTVIQHVSGHGYPHTIKTYQGDVITTTSVHHQMMNPGKVPHHMLAWATSKISRHYFNGEGDQVEMEKEPEVVYFPTIRALCIQGHPEYSDATMAFRKFCTDMVEEHLFPKEK